MIDTYMKYVTDQSKLKLSSRNKSVDRQTDRQTSRRQTGQDGYCRVPAFQLHVGPCHRLHEGEHNDLT